MLTSRDVSVLDKQLHPYPQKCRWEDGAPFRIEDNAVFEIATAEEIATAVPLVEIAKRYWGAALNFRVVAPGRAVPLDGYVVTVNERVIRVESSSTGGLRNALRTLRQLAESERGVPRVGCYTVAPCEIEDAPALAFRALHLCWFPEPPVRELESMIRMAAYCKCNYVIVENWGGIPLASHPELVWDLAASPNQDALRHLLDVAKEEGITLIPGFNLLGHASLSKINGLKHSTLSFHPELQSLFEPTGWSWCLANPATRELLRDVVLELLELFERPPFFHIGCDEAYDAGSCSLCRRTPVKSLIGDHIVFFHNLLAANGARAIMWHDMLLEKGDPRWTGYNANARPEEELGELWRMLPRDIVIADWEYEFHPENPEEKPVWPTADFFCGNGFDTLLCTLRDPAITASLGEKARTAGLTGFLMTT